jgi:hypothetical protein
MTHRPRSSAVRAGLFALALAGLGACTDRDVESIENGLWKMFAGHAKPIVLEEPAPPVYCYRTIGRPQCYAQPLEDEHTRPIR